MEEEPGGVTGERRARDRRVEATRAEHPGHQPAYRVRPQDHSQVPDPARGNAGLRTAAGAAEQTGALQAVPRRAAGGGRVEWAGVAAGTARPRLSRRLHDSERLAAPAARGGPDGGRAAVRDAA